MLEANYIQWKFNDTEKKILAHSFGMPHGRQRHELGDGRHIHEYNIIVLEGERKTKRKEKTKRAENIFADGKLYISNTQK